MFLDIGQGGCLSVALVREAEDVVETDLKQVSGMRDVEDGRDAYNDSKNNENISHRRSRHAGQRSAGARLRKERLSGDVETRGRKDETK